MEFEQACTEMNFILNNLRPEDLSKIPDSFTQFFKDNMDKNYNVKLTAEKPLHEQEIKEETKAFIKILYINYLAPKNKKETILNKLKEEEENEKNIIIKNDVFDVQGEKILKEKVQELVVYKENKIIAFIKNILKKLKIVK